MKFQAFHVNPGEKLKKKDVNNDLSNFMSVFPNIYHFVSLPTSQQICQIALGKTTPALITIYTLYWHFYLAKKRN